MFVEVVWCSSCGLSVDSACFSKLNPSEKNAVIYRSWPHGEHFLS